MAYGLNSFSTRDPVVAVTGGDRILMLREHYKWSKKDGPLHLFQDSASNFYWRSELCRELAKVVGPSQTPNPNDQSAFHKIGNGIHFDFYRITVDAEALEPLGSRIKVVHLPSQSMFREYDVTHVMSFRLSELHTLHGIDPFHEEMLPLLTNH